MMYNPLTVTSHFSLHFDIKHYSQYYRVCAILPPVKWIW